MRARSSPTTCCSPRSRSSCCSAPSSRSSSRRSTASASRSARPYFDRMTMPIGIALLFLMAVAPVLPWRKASGELLLHRLLWPAWIGTGVVVIAVALGAAWLRAAGRVRARRLRRRRGDPPDRARDPAARAGAGSSGRANGGMIVHLGVVMIAVALAASSSYSHSAEFVLSPGSPHRSPATRSPTSASSARRSRRSRS